MANGWTEERRRKQAAAIKKWQPWKNSTGPKSDKGKARSSLNALKTGGRSVVYREYAKALVLNRLFLKQIMYAQIMDRERMRATKELLDKSNKNRYITISKPNPCERTNGFLGLGEDFWGD